MNDMPDYFAGPTPAPGEVREVAPGLWWLRMPLPMALDHINLWIHEDGGEYGDGVAIIDTGIRSNKSKEIWQQALEKVAPGKPVTRVIVTHFHPDHVGHAKWLTETHGVPLMMPRTEWLYARMLSLDTGPGHMDGFVRLFEAAGCPSLVIKGLQSAGPVFPRLVDTPPGGIIRISGGDKLTIGARTWRVVTGRGHSPEHACLLSETDGIFISGDMVLPRISPHIGVYPDEPEADPLDDYLTSLETLKAVPGDVRVLPSHNDPFTGLHGRLASLRAHHEERLDRLMNHCAEPATAWSLSQALFDRKMTPEAVFFAIPETLAHLNLLRRRRMIQRHTVEHPDMPGVWHYARC